MTFIQEAIANPNFRSSLSSGTVASLKYINKMSSQTCKPTPDLLAKIKEFRFLKTKTTNCLLVKINEPTLEIILDEELIDTSLEAIVESLPSTSPRYILLSYTHTFSDGRISVPLIGIYYAPKSSSLVQKMVFLSPQFQMYASSKVGLFDSAEIRGKVFDLDDLEDFDEEWVKSQVEGSKTRI